MATYNKSSSIISFVEPILKIKSSYPISQFNTLVKSKKEWINSFSIIRYLESLSDFGSGKF